jgi:leucyl/phenylalanyl-tRNA--protein transferase
MGKLMDKTVSPRRSSVRKNRTDIAPETMKDRLIRYFFASVYAVQPKRIAALPPLTYRLIKFLLTPKAKRSLPANDAWLPGPECVVGFVHDTSPSGIMEGLREGMHISGHAMPLKWLAPRERSILLPRELHIEKRLARQLRQEKFKVSMDRDPMGVLNACAAPRPGRPPLTWLTPKMKAVQMDLFDAGIMHSLEVRDEDGALVGGLFGYAVDDLFMAESLFHTASNAGKVAMVALIAQLAEWDFTAADCDYLTAFQKGRGFKNVSRGALSSMLTRERKGPLGLWNFNSDFDLGRWNPAEGKCPRKADA